MRIRGPSGNTRKLAFAKAFVRSTLPAPLLVFLAVLVWTAAAPAWGQQCPYTSSYVLEESGFSTTHNFGRSVSSAGDVDNDGYDDVIVGVPGYGGLEGVPAGAGRAYVYSGRDRSIIHYWSGELADNEFGYSVSGAGDVNNDGYADVIVGAPYYTQTGIGTYCGKIYVYSGADYTELYSIVGEAGGDRFGWSVAGAGDVNHDGYDDFIVGAPWNDASTVDCGKARVYSGQSGAAIRTITIATADARLGYSVAGVGDADGDGWADFAVGVPGLNGGTGKVYVYSGQGGGLPSPSGEAAGDEFGHSVSGAGDVDNDGYDDVIVGALYYGVGSEGRAYLYSVHNGSMLYNIDHIGAGDQFGHTVSGIRNCFSAAYTTGDVDGDGYDDVIVGALMTELAEVHSGLDGSLLCRWTGAQPGDAFGWSVSGAGDVDSDGLPDVIVGAYLHDNEYTDEGRAYVFTQANLVPTLSVRGAVVLIALLIACGAFLILRRRKARART